MNAKIFKKYSILLVIPLIGIMAIAAFIYHFGHNDARAIAEFTAAYNRYDQAISQFSDSIQTFHLPSLPTSDDLEREADQALIDLKTKASARISSLTKNDGKIMITTMEIADISAKEMDALKAYQSAAAQGKPQLGAFRELLNDLLNQRRDTYIRFIELGEKNGWLGCNGIVFP